MDITRDLLRERKLSPSQWRVIAWAFDGLSPSLINWWKFNYWADFTLFPKSVGKSKWEAKYDWAELGQRWLLAHIPVWDRHLLSGKGVWWSGQPVPKHSHFFLVAAPRYGLGEAFGLKSSLYFASDTLKVARKYSILEQYVCYTNAVSRQNPDRPPVPTRLLPVNLYCKKSESSSWLVIHSRNMSGH